MIWERREGRKGVGNETIRGKRGQTIAQRARDRVLESGDAKIGRERRLPVVLAPPLEPEEVLEVGGVVAAKDPAFARADVYQSGAFLCVQEGEIVVWTGRVRVRVPKRVEIKAARDEVLEDGDVRAGEEAEFCEPAVKEHEDGAQIERVARFDLVLRDAREPRAKVGERGPDEGTHESAEAADL